MAGASPPRIGRYRRDTTDRSLREHRWRPAQADRGHARPRGSSRWYQIGDVRGALRPASRRSASHFKRLPATLARGSSPRCRSRARWSRSCRPGGASGRSTSRTGHADPHGLGSAVDAVADEIEPASAEAACLQTFAELGDELGDVTGDGLAAPIGSAAALGVPHEIGRHLLDVRLQCPRPGPSVGRVLVRSEGERRARLRQKIADRSAERSGDSGGRNAQRPARQPLQDDDGVALPGSSDRSAAPKIGPAHGLPCGVGDRGLSAQIPDMARRPIAAQHDSLAAVEMISACRVDDEPSRIGDDWHTGRSHTARRLARLVGSGIISWSSRPASSTCAWVTKRWRAGRRPGPQHPPPAPPACSCRG